MGKRIYIIAGEASGDLHGGNLVRELFNVKEWRVAMASRTLREPQGPIGRTRHSTSVHGEANAWRLRERRW